MTSLEASRPRVTPRPKPAASLLGVFLAAFLGGLCARPRTPRAKQSDPEIRPTRGPLITDAKRAGDADATAVELNPAQLGLLTAGSLELVAAGGTGPGAAAAAKHRGRGPFCG